MVGFGGRRARAGIVIAAGTAALLGIASLAAAGGVAGGRALDPSRFEPGSCVAFAPTSRRPLGRTVYIDVGHGGPDPGAVGVTLAGKPVHEATETLRVALDALAILRAEGYRVVLSRTSATAVARPAPGDIAGGVYTSQGVHRDLVAQDDCADLGRADIVIGVYFNASEDTSDGGSLTLFDTVRPFWRSSLRLAQDVQREVLAGLDAKGWNVGDDGVHTDVGYGSAASPADVAYGHLILLGPAKSGYLSTPTRAPAALIEPLFITNPAQASIADSASGERAMARGLASAVGDYFEGR
jgi:N-acetylmuramoyl-L-alanine amidase